MKFLPAPLAPSFAGPTALMQADHAAGKRKPEPRPLAFYVVRAIFVGCLIAAAVLATIYLCCEYTADPVARIFF